MAEHSTAGAPALSTNIESGKFDEKEAHHVPAAKQPVEEEEEDEDIDALIDDLESNDGHGDVSFPPMQCPAAAMRCGAQSSTAVTHVRFRGSRPARRRSATPRFRPRCIAALATGAISAAQRNQLCHGHC